MSNIICRCCHSKRIESQEPLGLNCCKKCGYRWQVQAKPFGYDQAYLEFGYNGAPLAAMSWVRTSFVYKHVKRFGKLLDIGYGFGNFVRTARDVGFDAYGFDIHNIDTGASAPRVSNLSGDWDVVTLFDSLEHFASFSEIFSINTEWYIVTVPHLYDMSMNEMRTWKHYKPDEHLHYFTTNAIESLFKKHGFRMLEDVNLEDVIRKPINGHCNTMTYAFRKITRVMEDNV